MNGRVEQIRPSDQTLVHREHTHIDVGCSLRSMSWLALARQVVAAGTEGSQMNTLKVDVDHIAS